MSTINVGVVGGTGYTGIELIRLLLAHPKAKLKVITSRSEQGKLLADLVPSFHAGCDLVFSEPSLAVLQQCDLIFFATPNGTAMKMVPELLAQGKRIIDLAADFRLLDAEQWQQWYGQKHSCPELLKDAVYGLPELNRAKLKDAKLVANPGCYPTAITLGLLPLLELGSVDLNNLIADAKSGVSGAGRGAQVSALHAEVSENFKAYGLQGHRHLPEISQTLQQIAGTTIDLTFVPHLLPMNRGIEATIYTRLLDDQAIDLTALYQKRYQQESFVTVLPAGTAPETRAVRASNHCMMSVTQLDAGRVVVSSVIDNLVKGAAGQAIQNMNIMYGWEESNGLTSIGLIP